MHLSERSERSCTDSQGQCLNKGDYVMDTSFTVTRGGRIKPPGRCYMLTYNPVKLSKPHGFYRRIAPREELLLNRLGGTPVWLVARIVHGILKRIEIEHPTCAAEESDKWRHMLNDTIIQLITHREARNIWGSPAAGSEGATPAAGDQEPQAAATATRNKCCPSRDTRPLRKRARSGPCARGAPRPPKAACCKGRGGEEEC